MKIALEYPYNTLWRFGYLRESQGRMCVDLYNSDSDRSTTAYARYLLAVKNGRFLTQDEEADHVDRDKTNNALSNLQILSTTDHKTKTAKELKELSKPHIEYVCKNCGEVFTRRSEGKVIRSFCSRRCNGIYNAPHGARLITVSKELHDSIVLYRLEGLSDYKISDITGLDRSKIFRYRKLNKIG